MARFTKKLKQCFSCNTVQPFTNMSHNRERCGSCKVTRVRVLNTVNNSLKYMKGEIEVNKDRNRFTPCCHYINSKLGYFIK